MTCSRALPGDGPRQVAGLARACHPGPAVAVTVLVTALTVLAGHGLAGRGLAGAAAVALAVLTGQLSVGWCNDAVDAARDATAGRTGKPIVAGLVTARTVRAAALTALAACVPLSLACGPLPAAAHLLAVAAAWAYNLWLKGTAASWAPYAIGFGAVPVFVAAGMPGGHGGPPCPRGGPCSRRRCSAAERTSATCCPTSRRTWRRACGAGPSGSAPPGSGR